MKQQHKYTSGVANHMEIFIQNTEGISLDSAKSWEMKQIMMPKVILVYPQLGKGAWTLEAKSNEGKPSKKITF